MVVNRVGNLAGGLAGGLVGAAVALAWLAGPAGPAGMMRAWADTGDTATPMATTTSAPTTSPASAPTASAPSADLPRRPAGQDEAAQAIDKAIALIWSGWENGHWAELGVAGAREGGGEKVNFAGRSALMAWALLSAGEPPQSERMKATLAWLARQESNGTYARALRACVWAELGRRGQYKEQLQADVDWLVRAMQADGGYSYTLAAAAEQGSDHSNGQLAVLGVWMGQHAGATVPADFWKRVEKHWVADQRDDGGWTYQGRKAGSYGSMTAAGVATLFLCLDNLYYGQFAAPDEFRYSQLTRGLEWLNANFAADTNPGRGAQYYYYLFCLERAGLAGGYKYFGKSDWFAQCGRTLLARQGANGGWGELTDTAWAVLFLARGRSPIIVNKLQYAGTWNTRPRDAAHLAEWFGTEFERPAQWQIVDLAAPAASWQDAPILYISGSSAPTFTDAEVDRLREFVLRGGLIFSEAAGSRSAFTLAMERYYARMFPGRVLERLPAGHELYQCGFKLEKADLLAVSNGVRLLAVHSPSELSLAWQQRDTRGEAFGIAANVILYATDKGTFPVRGQSAWPAPPRVAPKQTVKVARLKYEGNWNPEPEALNRLGLLMAGQVSVAVAAVDTPVEQLDAATTRVAVLTGTADVTFSAGQREALRKFLLAGGTLLADAAGGQAAFADAFKREMAEVLPDSGPTPIGLDHALLAGGATPIKAIHYRKFVAGIDRAKPQLTGYDVAGRMAVVFSPRDLTGGWVGCPRWALSGYEPRTAFEIARNVILYAMDGGKSAAPATQPASAPTAGRVGASGG